MSKWKCEICNSSFENFDARGFDNKIYCPLCYYKKLYKDTELERERLHSIIKEVREYIMSELITEWDIKNGGNVSGSDLPVEAITPILEILDKEKQCTNCGQENEQ